MIGGKLARYWGAAVCGILTAGCISLGDLLPGGTDATCLPRRPRPAEETTTPDLRIPVDAVAQGPDIPLVPVPPPPVSRQTPPAAAPSSRPTPPPVLPAKPTQVPDGSTAPAVSNAPPPAESARTPPHTARQLLQQAAARCATLDSYIVRLTRREFHQDKAQPEEIMLFMFRKDPWSVHFKWLGETARGREVVYVKGKYENKIHTKLAAGDAPLMPAGRARGCCRRTASSLVRPAGTPSPMPASVM